MSKLPGPDLFSQTVENRQELKDFSIGGILSSTLRTDPQVRSQMTREEQFAVDTLLKDVGTPEEYGSSAEYLLRALPYVRAVYSSLDVIHAPLPSKNIQRELMRSRFI